MSAVRVARPDDLDAVVAVGHRTWPATYTGIAGEEYVSRGLARWWGRDATLASIEAGRVAVAESDGEIVGMASFTADADSLTLWKLYVVPDEQTRGLGSALLDHVVGVARSAGVPAVRLEYVDGNERARLFYEAKGFREVGRETDPEGDPDSVWMELRVDGSAAAGDLGENSRQS